jgi:hypothetical protein
MRLYYRYLIALPLMLSVFSSNKKSIKGQVFSSSLFYKDSLFDMCSLMPGAEVAGLSQLGELIKQVIPDDRLEGYCGCHYDLQSDDDYPQVHISINEFSSFKEAREDYDMYRKDWISMYGRQPDEVTGLGDAACFMGNSEPEKCDDCFLQVIANRYYVTVKYKGYYDKIPASVKRNAAISIVKRLYEKKPYLGRSRL